MSQAVIYIFTLNRQTVPLVPSCATLLSIYAVICEFATQDKFTRWSLLVIFHLATHYSDPAQVPSMILPSYEAYNM